MMVFRLGLLVSLLVSPVTLWAESLLVINVNGYTLTAEGPLQRFDAMLLKDGRVEMLGSREALSERPHDAVHDGRGKTLLPGLIDAHGHVLGLGRALRQADLAGTRSLEEALERVRAHAALHPDAGWVLGRGWNQVVWNLDRFPTADELDRAEAVRPVWLTRVDGHAGWANHAALKLAGIDARTPDPAGGRIERDADGRPTGVLIDSAMNLVSDNVPVADADELRGRLDAALEMLASVGITSVHDAGVDVPGVELYRRYADTNRLTTRIYAMVGGAGEDFEALSAEGPLIGYGNDHLTVRSVKLFADGALGSRGAAMLSGYSDDPDNCGLLFNDTETLVALFRKVMSRGFQVNIHAIGDGANRQVLDAFSIAYQREGQGRELRNRVEHAQIVSLEDIPRFLPLQLTASMQPTHATSDMNMAEDRVGARRIQGAYAWRRFLDQGTPLAGGSDFPVESPNPFFGLHAAVSRRDHDGNPADGWFPEQSLSLEEALHAFTLGAARAAHQEATLGSLEPGKWADFILVDQDVFDIRPQDIWKTRVLETWVGGRRVHSR